MPHRNWVSRKKTIAQLRSIPTPRLNRKRQKKKNGETSTASVNLTPVIRQTISIGTREIAKLTSEEIVLERGYIYLGIYTFVMSPELPTMELSVRLQDSLKNEKQILPIIR